MPVDRGAALRRVEADERKGRGIFFELVIGGRNGISFDGKRALYVCDSNWAELKATQRRNLFQLFPWYEI
jgi:hypothetical protein